MSLVHPTCCCPVDYTQKLDLISRIYLALYLVQPRLCQPRAKIKVHAVIHYNAQIRRHADSDVIIHDVISPVTTSSSATTFSGAIWLNVLIIQMH